MQAVHPRFAASAWELPDVTVLQDKLRWAMLDKQMEFRRSQGEIRTHPGLLHRQEMTPPSQFQSTPVDWKRTVKLPRVIAPVQLCTWLDA